MTILDAHLHLWDPDVLRYDWLEGDLRRRFGPDDLRAAEADAGSKTVAAMPWLAETEVGMELMGLSDDQIKRAQAERRRAAGRNVLAALPPVSDADRA